MTDNIHDELAKAAARVEAERKALEAQEQQDGEPTVHDALSKSIAAAASRAEHHDLPD